MYVLLGIVRLLVRGFGDGVGDEWQKGMGKRERGREGEILTPQIARKWCEGYKCSSDSVSSMYSRRDTS